jgi:hypothetical protein
MIDRNGLLHELSSYCPTKFSVALITRSGADVKYCLKFGHVVMLLQVGWDKEHQRSCLC